MALNDISLTAGMRSNLISLQNTTILLDRTQSRLSTGKKVNTALDNPTNFFAAQNHTQRAADLTTRKDGMSEAIQGVRAANDGITGITALIEAARGLTQSARSADRSGRDSLSTQFNTMLTQITQLASDSSYKGKNFLKADSLQVLFNENGGSFLNINGFDATASGLALTSLTVGTIDTTKVGLVGGTGSQTADTAIHTAILNTSLTAAGVTAFTGFNMLGTTFSRTELVSGGAGGAGVFNEIAQAGAGLSGGANTSILGAYIDIANNSFMNAAGTTNSGLQTSVGTGYAISAVYANGTLLTAADYTIGSGDASVSGMSGGMFLQITSGQASGIADTLVAAGKSDTTIAFTFDISIPAHAVGSSAAAPSNIFIYDLAAGDTASGASGVVGMDASTLTTLIGNFTGHSGVAVYVSGMIANPNTYAISGSYLIFTTSSGAPSTTTGAIQYNYNTGFSLTAGANITPKLQFTGITLVSGQSITNVKIDGVTTTDYSLTGTFGNTIQFATGFKPAIGAVVTYTVTTAGINGSWAGTDAGINASVEQLDSALSTLRTQTAALASNLSVVNIRQDFTSNLVNDLLKGADNLTLADTNEEGANMLMLQTRQQLGTTSLKMASDAAQSVLRLF